MNSVAGSEVLSVVPASEQTHRALRVLIGPTSLPQLEEVNWGASSVKYLRKVRSGAGAAHHIYYDTVSMSVSLAGKSVPCELSEFILRLNTDINCFYLSERDRQGFFNGSLLAPVDIAACARYAWSILEQHRPDLIVFHNVPHELFTYALLRLALELNIPVVLVHYAVLPWRICISRYLRDGSTRRFALNAELTPADRISIRDYMSRLQGDHERAIPATNLKMITASGSMLSYEDEWQSMLRGDVIKSAVRVLVKRALYKAYRRHAANEPDPARPYVVFFLHYQPEETTIPRGGIFAQQLNAILRLRSLLPSHVNLLVKENRATFRLPLALAIGVRNEEFYSTISSMANTFLVPLERDTFALVDGALAVATITGSVGIEALCRSKRVIIFGDATYKHFSGVTVLTGSEDDRTKIEQVLSNANRGLGQTEDDFLNEIKQSFGPNLEQNQTNLDSQRRTTIQAFEWLTGNLDRLMSAPLEDATPAY